MKAQINEVVSHVTQNLLDDGISVKVTNHLNNFLNHVTSVVMVTKCVEIMGEFGGNENLVVDLRQTKARLHHSAPISMDCQFLSKMSQFLVKLVLVIEHVISIDVRKCYLNDIVANLIVGEVDEITIIEEQYFIVEPCQF